MTSRPPLVNFVGNCFYVFKKLHKKINISKTIKSVNMSGKDDFEYFSDGITEEIINALTKVQGLKVLVYQSQSEPPPKDQSRSWIFFKLNSFYTVIIRKKYKTFFTIIF